MALPIRQGQGRDRAERQATLLDWFRLGHLHTRYCESLGKVVGEIADAEDVLLVGRGASRFLKHDPRAFHVRLVADYGVRLRHVMEGHWLAEGPAKHLIDRTNAHRKKFYETLFGVDWTSPLGYHLTLNIGRMGAKGADLVAWFAALYWGGAGGGVGSLRTG